MSVIGLPCIVCGMFAAVMNADAYERATLAEMVCVCPACEARIEADGEPEVLLLPDEAAICNAIEQERDRAGATMTLAARDHRAPKGADRGAYACPGKLQRGMFDSADLPADAGSAAAAVVRGGVS